jgi:hypothetical protein
MLRDAAIHAPITIADNNDSPVQARRSLCMGAINQSHRDKKSAAAYGAQYGNLSDSKTGEETEGRRRAKNHDDSKSSAPCNMRRHCAAS